MPPVEPLRYTPLTGIWDDAAPGAVTGQRDPDRRDGAVYVHEPELRLAVDVALATGRPLLLQGEPGSGKSSWAAYAARNMGWRYYDHVVSSRTRPADLLWRFDAVRRLADAQAGGTRAAALNAHEYLEPGVLWWVFDRASAQRRGEPEESFTSPAGHELEATSSRVAVEPHADVNRRRDDHRCVVLIDEIDKADPDLPNGLLVPLASRRFVVTETGTEVRYQKAGPSDERLLLIITTNEERELPPAFLRRCVVHRLRFPKAQLGEIAARHAVVEGNPFSSRDAEAADLIAKRVVQLRKEAETRGLRPPGTAEYLDAVRAYRTLKLDDLRSRTWAVVERLTLLKHDDDHIAELDPGADVRLGNEGSVHG
jgi:MoxR-like ATPase